MEKRIYETDNDYILDIFEDEEERLLAKLTDVLPSESKYLFYRYVSLRDTMEEIKHRPA